LPQRNGINGLNTVFPTGQRNPLRIATVTV
jgi:hypothetical protein